MATYYLSSTGSNTAPYDTEAKAATSMWSIRAEAGFTATDTIILCNDVTDTSWDGPTCNKWCNVEAKAGLPVRPKYKTSYNSGGPFYAGTETLSISNIEFINNSAGSLIIQTGSDVTFTNCIFEMMKYGSEIATFEECLIIISANNTILSSLSGAKFSANKCTFLDRRSTTSATQLLNGLGNTLSVSNCIFYDQMGPSSRAAVIQARDAAQTEDIHDNIFYTTTTMTHGNPWSIIDPEFMVEGLNINNGVNNTKTDPLFLESVNYTLKRISPAIKAGVGSVNIGWDQVTIGLPADAPLGLVTSTPTKSYAGDLLSDSDNGGGIDTTNTNDYSSGLYNLGNLRR